MVTIVVATACWAGGLQEAKAAVIVNDPPGLAAKVWHTLTDKAGWVMEQAEWVVQAGGMLDQLNELITNNVITKAIKGFNELMTAIQTDISDVMGTVESLVNAPGDIVNSLMDTIGGVTGAIGGVMDIPKSIFGMISSLPSQFEGIYNDIVSGFGIIGEAQAMGTDMASAFENAGGTFNFRNRTQGVNWAANASWLEGSQSRDRKVRKSNTANKGTNAITLQKTQLEIQLEGMRQEYRRADMEAMRALESASEKVAEAASVKQQLKAATEAASRTTVNKMRLRF